MKRGLLIIAFLLSVKGFSQAGVVVTSAPTLETMSAKELSNSLEQLAESANQPKELVNTYSLAKDAFDLLQTVNENIKTGRVAVNILDDVAQTGLNISELYEIIRKKEIEGKGKKAVRALLDAVYSLNQRNEDIGSDIVSVLKDRKLIMNDAERLEYLRDLEDKVNEIRAKSQELIFYLQS